MKNIRFLPHLSEKLLGRTASYIETDCFMDVAWLVSVCSEYRSAIMVKVKWKD